MSSRITRKFLAALALVAGVAAPIAWSQFTVIHVPPFRGAPCTEYSAFESFTQAYNAPNFPDQPGTTSPDTALVQLVAGAVITAQGNIDHLSLPPAYRLTDSVPADLQEVVFQVSSLLNQFPWSTVVLKYVDGLGVTQSVVPTSSTHLVFLMGREERLIRWDLSGLPATILGYTIEFSAQSSSTTLDAITLDTRYACGPGATFCAGDGTGAACPCANGLGGRGCENSFATGGGRLSATGTAVVGADTLVLAASGLPTNASVLFFQGTQSQSGGAGIVFGDGIRCAGGSVIRLGTKTASVGEASFGHGIGSDPDVSVRGAVPAGALRYYQAWYRNAAVYCTPSTFNLTNGLAVQW